jgi:hypothetical protein
LPTIKSDIRAETAEYREFAASVADAAYEPAASVARAAKCQTLSVNGGGVPKMDELALATREAQFSEARLAISSFHSLATEAQASNVGVGVPYIATLAVLHACASALDAVSTASEYCLFAASIIVCVGLRLPEVKLASCADAFATAVEYCSLAWESNFSSAGTGVPYTATLTLLLAAE